MNKILLIIKREYLTRVRKRTFIVSTLLFPLLYIGLIFGTGYVAKKSVKVLHVAVIDSSGYFSAEALEKQNASDGASIVTLANDRADSVIHHFSDMGYDGYIVIPAMSWDSASVAQPLVFKSRKSYGNSAASDVESKLNHIWDELKNDKLGIDAAKRKILTESRLAIIAKDITNEKADADVAQGIGYTCGLLIYLILLIYGSQVMMGVMEEKTNRIAEVIVSSVRPFQMMLGKIIGIGLVGLTQFLLWIGFVFLIYNLVSVGSGDIASTVVSGMQKMFVSIDLPLILFCFGFYFLAGFFFYASLYGAIGSAVNEDMKEAQSLSFPITILVIMSLALMSSTVANPTSPVAVWASIIPFSSPIVMMARIPFGVPNTVPWWQLFLSMALLVVGFIFTTWVAGKIYRTGILMYGKKPSWKEMIRWAFRKN